MQETLRRNRIINESPGARDLMNESNVSLDDTSEGGWRQVRRGNRLSRAIAAANELGMTMSSNSPTPRRGRSPGRDTPSGSPSTPLTDIFNADTTPITAMFEAEASPTTSAIIAQSLFHPTRGSRSSSTSSRLYWRTAAFHLLPTGQRWNWRLALMKAACYRITINTPMSK